MGLYFNREQRRDIQRLNRLWEARSVASHLRMLLVVSILFMAARVPFDLALFGGEALAFIRVRVAMAVLAALALFVADTADRRGYARIERAIFLFAALLVPLCQLYFLASVAPSNRFAVLIANLLVAFASALLVHRFWLIQHASWLVAFVTSLVLASVSEGTTREFELVAMGYLSAGAVGAIFRRQFFGTMFATYRNLCTLVPSSIAFHLASTGEAIEDTEAFRPANRFTVCVCVDWRNYQHKARTMPAQEVLDLLNRYYEIVLDELPRYADDGSFYFDWVADELFIVFFATEDCTEEDVSNRAARFVLDLATKIFDRIQTEVRGEIMFDIGVSCGPGLIGLQGPKQKRKTTITGEAAGRARRLQTEAKQHRRSVVHAVRSPLVAMDKAMGKTVFAAGLVDPRTVLSTVSMIQDIEAQDCYLWSRGMRPSDIKAG